MSTAAVKGVLKPYVVDEVNLVNASTLARLRGTVVEETRRQEADGYANLVTVTVETAKGTRSAAGTLFGLSGPVLSGVYAGALTNTPALAASTERLQSEQPIVGYSVTYLFGVLGMLVAAGFAGTAALLALVHLTSRRSVAAARAMELDQQ